MSLTMQRSLSTRRALPLLPLPLASPHRSSSLTRTEGSMISPTPPLSTPLTSSTSARRAMPSGRAGPRSLSPLMPGALSGGAGCVYDRPPRPHRRHHRCRHRRLQSSHQPCRRRRRRRHRARLTPSCGSNWWATQASRTRAAAPTRGTSSRRPMPTRLPRPTSGCSTLTAAPTVHRSTTPVQAGPGSTCGRSLSCKPRQSRTTCQQPTCTLCARPTSAATGTVATWSSALCQLGRPRAPTAPCSSAKAACASRTTRSREISLARSCTWPCATTGRMTSRHRLAPRAGSTSAWQTLLLAARRC
mmetsp:Transcript_59556/g.143013  ORF Transcript_59556/g.143013 Transcript_59556/m.143013 type:complete len:302 (-) Transcript_59556:142-1047(-)